jgi:hypothetical protein
VARLVTEQATVGQAVYQVSAFGVETFEPQTFLGDYAFDRANDHLDTLLTDSGTRQLWLLRYSGLAWQLVVGVERDADSGAWEPISWADLPVAESVSDCEFRPPHRHRLIRLFGR